MLNSFYLVLPKTSKTNSNLSLFLAKYAQLCLNNNEGCELIATNCDALTHFTEDQLWAGAGAMVGALKGCCPNKECVVVGKPSPFLIEHIAKETKVERSKMLMIGDRLDTDILFGKVNGMSTLLVLSGVTNEEEMNNCSSEYRPDFVARSIADFLLL